MFFFLCSSHMCLSSRMFLVTWYYHAWWPMSSASVFFANVFRVKSKIIMRFFGWVKPKKSLILFGCWEDQSSFTCNTSIYHHIPSYAKSSAIFWSRLQASHASFEAIQHPFWSYGLETISCHVIFNHQQTFETLYYTHINTPILGLIFLLDGWMDGSMDRTGDIDPTWSNSISSKCSPSSRDTRMFHRICQGELEPPGLREGTRRFPLGLADVGRALALWFRWGNGHDMAKNGMKLDVDLFYWLKKWRTWGFYMF